MSGNRKKNRVAAGSQRTHRSTDLTIRVDPGGVIAFASENHKRIYVSVNAIAFAFNQIAERYEKILEILGEIDAGADTLGPNGVAIELAYPRRNELVGLAWDFVDWANRLGKLLHAAAGVKKSDPWFGAMSRALSATKDVREYMQHFDGSLSELLSGCYPIGGSVTAWYGTFEMLHGRVIVSTPARFAGDSEVTISGYSLPTDMPDAISHVTLSVASRSINISKVFSQIDGAKTLLVAYLRDTYSFEWPEQA